MMWSDSQIHVPPARLGAGKFGDAMKRGWSKVKSYAKDNKLGSALVDKATSALEGALPEFAPAIGAVGSAVKGAVSKRGYGPWLPGRGPQPSSASAVGEGRKRKKKKKKKSTHRVRSVAQSEMMQLGLGRGGHRGGHTPHPGSLKEKKRKLKGGPHGLGRGGTSVGSKIQVWNGTASQTPGGLTKAQLIKNKRGKVVSKAKMLLGKRNKKFLQAVKRG